MKETICLGLLLLLLLLFVFSSRVERFNTLQEYSDVVREVQKRLDRQGTDVIQVQIKSKTTLWFHVVDRATLKGYLIDVRKTGNSVDIKEHTPSVPNKTTKHNLFFS